MRDQAEREERQMENEMNEDLATSHQLFLLARLAPPPLFFFPLLLLLLLLLLLPFFLESAATLINIKNARKHFERLEDVKR